MAYTSYDRVADGDEFIRNLWAVHEKVKVQPLNRAVEIIQWPNIKGNRIHGQISDIAACSVRLVPAFLRLLIWTCRDRSYQSSASGGTLRTMGRDREGCCRDPQLQLAIKHRFGLGTIEIVQV